MISVILNIFCCNTVRITVVLRKFPYVFSSCGDEKDTKTRTYRGCLMNKHGRIMRGKGG